MTLLTYLMSQLEFRRRVLLGSFVMLLVIVCDQSSKLAVLTSIQRGEQIPVIPGFFNLTLAFNYGAAFGLWGNLSPGMREVVLAVTILLALSVVVFFMRQPAYQNRIGQASLSAIMGGAIGNIIDRIARGAVVDFLDFHVGTYHWPAFNLADSAICIGVTVLVLMPHPKGIPVAENEGSNGVPG